MARKLRDFDTELQALTERTKKLKSQKTVQLGELVQVTGADTLSVEALAGALLGSVLAALEQSKKQPEAMARWTERGQAFFQQGGKRGRKSGNGVGAADSNGSGTGEPTAEAASHDGMAAAPDVGAA